MNILVTPSDLIKRCLWLEYQRYFLSVQDPITGKKKLKPKDEITKFIQEDKPMVLKEEDAFVIGLLKVVETPHIVYRFKDHIEDYLKIKSSIINNRLWILKNIILKEIITFKDCFPEEYNAPFEYKKGIEDMKKFVDNLYSEIEKIEPTKITDKDEKIKDYVSSNQVKNILTDK